MKKSIVRLSTLSNGLTPLQQEKHMDFWTTSPRNPKTYEAALAGVAVTTTEDMLADISRVKDSAYDLHTRNTLEAVTDMNACWLYQGAVIKKNGYGLARNASSVSPTTAHRYVYKSFAEGNSQYVDLDASPVPLVLDHLCENRLCVNPSHMAAVIQFENMLRSTNGLASTHCKHGHDFDEANTRWYSFASTNKKGVTRYYLGRKCRACIMVNEGNAKLRLALAV